MNLKQLKYFKILAKTQHMTQAAELLSITQPNLSHAMSELENELGTFLFEKNGRNIHLTKYGKIFLSYVESSLQQLEQGKRAIKELTSPDEGHVDLGFIYTLGPSFVPILLKEFRSKKSNKKISFSFYQGNTNNIIKQLKDEQVDIALCSRITSDEQIHFEPISEEDLVLITPLDHPLARYDNIDITDTAGYPFISFIQESGIRPLIDDMFSRVKVIPKIICEVEEDQTMAGFVSIGHGIAIIPHIPALNSFPIKVIPIKNPPYHRYIYAATLRNHYLSPAAINFLNFVINYGRNKFLYKGRKI